MEIKYPNELQFLSGGGEMGKLTREKDWSKTTLGTPQFWPQSLRTTLSIILNSKFPMFLFWGKELTCFYNDAYRPSLGKVGKHPSILGMNGEDAWTEIWPIIKPLIDQVLAGGDAIWSEDQLIPIYRNGKIEDVYWTFSYSPVNDESGKPAGVFVTCTETTDKVITHRKIEESKNELEFAIEATELGTWDYNPATNKFSANNRLKGWFGLSDDDDIELTDAVNIIVASDRQRVTEAIQNALDFLSGGNYDVEYTIVHPASKKESIVHAKGRAWFNNEKVAYRFNGTLEDVTLQVDARKQIEASEVRFRSLISQSPIPMVVFRGPEHIIEIANKAILKRWNKSIGEIENKRFIDVFPEVKNEKFPALLDEVYKTGKVYSEKETISYIQEKDGKTTLYVDFEYSPLREPDGKVSGIIATVNDVTEKVLARKKTEESETRYHNLIHSSPSAIGILYGKNLIVTIANEAIIEIWGKGKEIIGKAYFEALPELSEQGYKEVFAAVYNTGVPFNAVETPVRILQNGEMTLKYYNFLLYPQKNMNGEIDGIGIIATDVTSQAVLNNKVKESEKRFRLLADSMPQIIWTSDALGNLNYFNQAVVDYSGLSLDQINKDGWMQIMHPDDREKNIAVWKHSITTGKDFLLEHCFRKHTGEYRWQLSRAIPQRDENGTIQLWVGTSTDIQEQKTFADELESQVQERTAALILANESLKKSEERYHLMVAEVQEYAILYLSREGIVENWNEGAEKIKGYKANEIIGKSLSNFYTEEDRKNKLPQQLLAKAVETGRAIQEGWRVRKDGSLFWASVVITAVHNEKKEVIGFSKVTHDLTEKKNANDRLTQYSLQLEQKNIDLEKMNKELQSFTYISSHDLQEPLRKIQTFSSRILEKEYQLLSDAGKDYFDRMQNAALRMQTLIDDLLAYSRTNTGERKYEPTDLNKIIEEVKSDLQEDLKQKHATIETNGLCKINIIPFQFRQLLHNLFYNSLKFSRPAQPLHIKIESNIAKGATFRNARLRDDVSYCHISFSDNGIGFEQKYGEKIFELFQRLHSKLQYNGTGIGLAIVKRIVENHSGIITATGTLNKGATFDIYLPVTSVGNGNEMNN
jgi:PAS domain S-box-containing protein